MINARAFLNKEGFIFDKNTSQLDRLFLKQFSEEKAAEIEAFWHVRNFLGTTATKMYAVSQTAKQAHILMSHDRARYVAGLDWLTDEVTYWRPNSIVEMGCGTGVLLRFLKINFPDIILKGLDAEPSFVAIARQLSNLDIELTNYLELAAPQSKFDAVVCNFGFDLDRFTSSDQPHSTAKIGRSEFCPACADNFSKQFEEYTANWRLWGNEHAKLFLVGRLPNFGYIRAVIVAAAKSGWGVVLDRCRYLKVPNGEGQNDNFPAIVFAPAEIEITGALLEDAERVFRIA